MPNTTKYLLAYGLCVAALGSTACTPKRIPPMTVADLMEDRVTLDGVLLKCNENPERARTSSDCLNARIAIDRLAQDVDPAVEAKRNAEFERRREKLRMAQDKIREEQDSKTKVDAYTLPMVPVDAAPGAAPVTPPAGGAAPVTPPASGAAPGLVQAKP